MQHCHNILEQLASSDSEILREAAFDAGNSRCEDAVERLAGLLESGHIGVQEAAENALRKIGGSNAIAAVAPLLRSESAPQRNMSMDILREIGNQDMDALIALLHDDDPDIRIFASDILGSADCSKAAVALGEALLKDPEVNVRYQAAVSLGELGKPEGAPYLNKAMSDEEWVQFAVIEALTKIKDDTSVGALAGALDKTSDLVAAMIVDALGEMGNVKAVGLLTKRLGSDQPEPMASKIACAVVSILGAKVKTMLSPADRENLRLALLQALEDEEPEMQDKAIKGLAFVGGETAAVNILGMASSLDKDQEPERYQDMIDALASIGSTQALQDALTGTDPVLTAIAVETAQRIGHPDLNRCMMEIFPNAERNVQRTMISALAATAAPMGEEAATFFRSLLDPATDGHVIKGALSFLGDVIDCCSGEAVFALTKHQYDDVKEAAIEASVRLWDEEMSSRFAEMSTSEEPVERLMAAYAFGKARDMDRAQNLKDALGDPIPDIRKVAVEALAEVLGNDPDLVPTLVPTLNDEHPAVRLAVVEALGAQKSNGEIVPLLVGALNDEDDWVRIRAMQALAASGQPEAARHIAGLVGSESALVTIKAVESLRDLGGEQATEALSSLSSHDDPQIRSAAQEALDVMASSHM